MLSISHWGMFAGRRFIGKFHGCAIFEGDELADDDAAPRFVVPAGFKVSDADRAEWRKPGGVIMLERVSR